MNNKGTNKAQKTMGVAFNDTNIVSLLGVNIIESAKFCYGAKDLTLTLIIIAEA
jgi:hypothetical protein